MTTPTVTPVGSGDNPAATSITIPWFGTLNNGQLGDIYTFVVYASGASAFVTPSSVTVVASGTGWIAVQRIIDGTEGAGLPLGTGLTISWTGNVACGYFEFNARGATPYVVNDGVGVNLNGSSTNITAPTITPIFNADLLVSIYLTATQHAITAPASQTTGFVNTVGTHGYSVALGYETLTSNAATGTRVATCGTAATNLAVNFAFRPALVATNQNGLFLPSGANEIVINNPPPTLLVENNSNFAGGTIQVIGFATGYGSGWTGASGSQDAPLSPPATNGPVGRGNYSTPRYATEAYLGFGQSQGWGGNASISGQALLINNNPLGNVWLFLSPMNAPTLVIAAQFTDADGNFSFTQLLPGKYMVEGYDPSGFYNGGIVTWIEAY